MPKNASIATRKSKAEILRIIRSLPRSLGASQAFLRRVGLALLGQIEKNYRIKAKGGTDQCNLRWKPLSPFTLQMRRKAGKVKSTVPPDEILRVTDRLLDSLTPAGDPESTAISLNPDQIFNVEKNAVEVGSAVEYAIKQHKGVPAKNLPQRRLWPDPNRWASAWWRPIVQQAALAAGELVAKEIG
jgi:hypothetical protein